MTNCDISYTILRSGLFITLHAILYLQPVWCTDLSSDENRLTYDLDTNGKSVVPISPDPCLEAALFPVKTSNMFVLTMKDHPKCSHLSQVYT